MKKRIAILGIYHESNTFSSTPTSWTNFADGHIFERSAILQRYQGTHHEIGGFLKGMDCDQVELVPVYVADAIPSGTIEQETIDRLIAELLQQLELVMPIDAVYGAAHGAAVSEDVHDVDGHWMTRVREMVGPDTPVVCTLDPHANVSPLMAASSDALIAYSTNPHLDQWQTGIKAAQLLKKKLFGSERFKQELIQLPASISIEQQETAQEPCLSLYKQIGDLIQDKPIISHSIILGFPYADVEEMGTSCILISEEDYDTTALRCQIVAVFERFYSQFVGTGLCIEDVLANRDQYQKPVLLLDMGDNLGAGAKGDSAYLLHALEAKKVNKACLVVYRPDLVAECDQHELGEWITIDLKGADRLIQSIYRVQLLEKKSGRFTETSPRHGGQKSYNMGEVALVVTESGNYVVLMSLRVPPFSAQQLAIFNLDLNQLDWIIAKGVNAPIAAYQEICPIKLKIQTPGESNANARQLSYQFRRRPMWPFETLPINHDIQ